ncbi:MAG: hypothetical protein IPJ77_19215 [Planctomycetes bacterium]|nr:hypothetical protein [Planctomycetota bacterium]
MRETFLPDDPRRTLLEQAHYLPLDALAPEDGPTPDKVEAMYSIRTGNVYVKRPTAQSCPQLASNIAHELHHMQLDHGESINRMQECDRERVAHAREAKDLGRMIAAVPAGSADAERWLLAFELQQAQARSLSAMYNSKFELFRLVQALDRVDHLRDMTVLYPLYERCIEIAQKPLATEHQES